MPTIRRTREATSGAKSANKLRKRGLRRSSFVSYLCLETGFAAPCALLDCGMAPMTANTDLQLTIERQAVVIETLRAHIAGFEALATMIAAQEPLVPLGEAHEAVLAQALARVS